jgi:hypothetical protein
MSDATVKQGTGAEPAPQVDQNQLRFALEQLRSQQNLVGGALAGLAASAVGAAAWAGITVATGYQIGWMAVGVGFLVGLAVRFVGKGIDSVFGVVGAVLALLGCAAGNLLTVCGLVAGQEGIAFADVIGRLDPATVRDLMVATFQPMDLLFYAIAVYEGYKLSFRQLSQQELGSLLPGR